MNAALLKRSVGLRSVPPGIVLLTAATSYVGLAVGNVEAWPLWGVVLAGLLPWLPTVFLETIWTYRHYSMLAVFYILVITQLGHFSEHIVQMVQIHVLQLSGVDARGVVGALDIEWVHFVFNSWLLVAEVILLRYFRRNPFKHLYDEWLARAFPQLPADVLIETTGRLQTMRFPAGEAVVRQGEVADRLYIITRGEVEVTQLDHLGRERHVRRLKAGQYFGEMGILTRSARTATVRACTPVEVLCVDRATLGALLDRSQATADELARVVRTRLAPSPEPGR